MEGIRALAGCGSRFEELAKEFEEIYREFEQETQRKREALETLEKEKLRTLGVSGPAIKPNLRESKDWHEAQSQIRQSYDLKLDRFRKSLVQITEVE